MYNRNFCLLLMLVTHCVKRGKVSNNTHTVPVFAGAHVISQSTVASFCNKCNAMAIG